MKTSLFGRSRFAFAMQAAQSRAALPFDAKALTSIGSNEEVRRGLRAAIREGRRGGFTVLQFAGLTLSAQQATPNQVKPRRRRRRPKTPAQREKSAADFEQKRLRSKLLSVLPIVNRIMSARRNPAQPASALCATASESVTEMTDSRRLRHLMQWLAIHHHLSSRRRRLQLA